MARSTKLAAVAPAVAPAASFAGLTLTLTHIKSTPGTHVYGEGVDDATVRSLYLPKHLFNGDAPKTLTLTLA